MNTKITQTGSDNLIFMINSKVKWVAKEVSSN